MLTKLVVEYLSPKYNLMYSDIDESEDNIDIPITTFGFVLSSSNYILPQLIIIRGIQRLLQQSFQGELPEEYLSLEKFNSFPILKFSDLNNYYKNNNIINEIPLQCCICQTDFNNEKELILLPKCNHVFDKECIKIWLTEKHHVCPICRTDCN